MAPNASDKNKNDVIKSEQQIEEQHSNIYDLPPPQMNIEQMREFGRQYNHQREQEQWKREQILQQIEQTEQARADKELEEQEQLQPHLPFNMTTTESGIQVSYFL